KNKRLDYELSRLRQLRDMDGTLYIFFNESTNSAFTINAAPLMEMNSNSAKDLLEMVRSNHEEASKASNHQYEKVSAKYSDRSENQIFKAVYKITGKEMEEPVYAHSYIISHENITLYISGTSVGEFDYDPYIETINF
ncbi:MAG: hypothetical protein R3213_11865, partial [Flavobacteriaceae bacterium]|nr:hypothetical protein [Flavobacteriaceae bacterium]